jgi:hypothetical protein
MFLDGPPLSGWSLEGRGFQIWKQRAGTTVQGTPQKRETMNTQGKHTSENDSAQLGRITPENAYVEADRHIGLAMQRIEEARHDSATGAMRTCSLLLDVLAGIRTPLHRLGSVVHPRHRQHQDAADSHPMPPEFAVESSEVAQ